MDCLRLWEFIILWASEVLGYTNRRIVSDLFALLTDGVLTRATLRDGVFIAVTTVTLAVEGLPLIFPHFAIAETGGTHTDIYSVRISGVLERGCLMRARGFQRCGGGRATGFLSLLCHLFLVLLVDVRRDSDNGVERVVHMVGFCESILDEGRQVLPIADELVIVAQFRAASVLFK